MKPYPILLFAACLAVAGCDSQSRPTGQATSFAYPKTSERPVTDAYFGLTVTDNYRWLEAMNQPEAPLP
ncbi:MAG: hypothetical protein H7Z75_19100 [Ferruginibacter sp.]|nr:hypothetical protein [Cytophagales bacterium]